MKLGSFCFIIFLIGFLMTHILGCFFSQPKHHKNGDLLKYLNDPEYILQKHHMSICKKELNFSDENYRNILKNYIVYHACYAVKDKLSLDDSIRFSKRGFIECFEIVAEHKAYKIVCDSFRNQYMDYDLLELIAILEYEECIAKKNDPFIREILFDMPEIFKDDFTALSESILNN